jgi:hypothetical protein
MPKKVDRLEYVSLKEAATPRDGEVITNRWWVVHPEDGIAFYRMPQARFRAPQCNHDERIARDLCDKLYPGHDVALVPVVFVGHRPQGEW